VNVCLDGGMHSAEGLLITLYVNRLLKPFL